MFCISWHNLANAGLVGLLNKILSIKKSFNQRKYGQNWYYFRILLDETILTSPKLQKSDHWLRRNRSLKINVTHRNFVIPIFDGRSSTINFSAANDRIFAILGLLESFHQGESESDVSFVIFSLVKKIFKSLKFY